MDRTSDDPPGTGAEPPVTDQLSVATLQAALVRAGLPVVTPDDLYLSPTEGVGLCDTFQLAEADGTGPDTDAPDDDRDGFFFEVALHLVEGAGASDQTDVEAVVAIPLLGLDEEDLVTISAWFQHQAIPHGGSEDDEGDPWLLLTEYMEEAELRRAPQWVAGLLQATKEFLRELDQETAGPDPDFVALQPAIHLRQQGRVNDAIEAAEKVLAKTGPTLTPRARGMALAVLGELQLETDRLPDGARDTHAAIGLLTDAGDALNAARAELNLVAVDLGHGRLDPALERCAQVAEVMVQLGNQNDRDRVTCRHTAALAEHRRYKDALALVKPLEQRLSKEDEPSPVLDDVRQILGAIEASIGPSDPDYGPAATLITSVRSNDPMDQARTLANRAGDLVNTAMNALRRPEDSDLSPADTAAKHAWDALAVAAEARAVLPQALPPDIDEALTQAEIFARALAGDEASAVSEARQAAARATARRSPVAAELLGNAGWFAQRAGLVDEALTAYNEALALAEDLDLYGLTARLHTNIALTHIQDLTTAAASSDGTVRSDAAVDRDVMRAIQRHTQAALRAWDEQDLQFLSPEARSRWAAQRDPLLTTATLVMSGTGKHRTAARLIELARAQGLPDHETGMAEPLTPPMPAPPGEAPASQPPGAAAPPQSAEAPVPTAPEHTAPPTSTDTDAELQQVRASLGDLAVTAADPDDPLTATPAVGGPGAWRWLLRRAPGMILWAVVEPDGEAHSGFVHIRDQWGANPAAASMQLPPPGTTFVGPALEQFRRAVRPDIANHQARMDEIVNGLLVEDPSDDEPGWAWELGQHLIPEVLARELRRRLKAEHKPLPLVIAPSSVLSGLPFALLGLEAPQPGAPSAEARSGRRLVEAAVISIAPPSGGLAERAADRVTARNNPTPPLPVHMAIINPTGPTGQPPKDLDHVNNFLLEHREILETDDCVVYAGPTAQAFLAGHAQEPSLTAILTSFTEQAALPFGVLVIAAHATPAPDDLPLGSGIPLRSNGSAERERLTVGHLLQPGINSPSRVLLHGCSSLGVDANLNEWWGLPIALLHAGSTGVLAAGWDLIDSRGAVEVTSELLDAARTAPDLAVALRDIQLRHLGAWREQREAGRRFESNQQNHHPHLWAGWAYVGAYRG